MAQWVPQVPISVNLRRLFPAASFVGCGDIHALAATDRSSECGPNMLFAVIRGHRTDGYQYIQEAICRGATALLVDSPQPGVAIPQCVVPDVRRAYAELCVAQMAQPARNLGLAGVTGTNGKTTISWLIRSILQGAGKQTGILGTIEYSDGQNTESSSLTTPDPRTWARWLASMVTHGTTHAALELSSHALDQRRTAGTLLDVAIISNITQDHFDYHKNFEAYRLSKLRIFEYLKPAGLAVVNVDDPGSLSCLDDAPKRTMTYGLDGEADVTATIIEETLHSSRFRLVLGGDSQEIETHLIGRHNISNCLAAATAAMHFGASCSEIASGIEALASVPGRMEQVDCGQPFQVFVDYAHTEDALRRSVRFLRRLTPGRIICVFGAGGDRDRTKRPLLGNAASEADVAVVTSDNPRSEDQHQIIQEILAGFAATGIQPHIEADREHAICWALDHAEAGDTVLVAGKGHETEQIIGTQRRHFDDRAVIRSHLEHNPSLVEEPRSRRIRNQLHV